MCGISGVLCGAPLQDDDVAALQRINAALIHRGPDSEGFFRDRHVAMAMRRLSIVDLAGGQQPLFNEDRTLSLVCNGEIYNHKELRADLASRGHGFHTGSDVETILHLYEEKAADCVDRLRGMYAFALWDQPNGKLLLGRDRLGEKPLYLWRDRRADGAARLWWASELGALLSIVPAERRRLAPAGINEFLTFQYALEPESLVEGIVQLPAAHTLMVGPRILDAQPRRYWSALDVPATSADQSAERVREWLDRGCLRMGSADVPVGVALSGGIDSSLVAAITARHYPGQIHAFSVGYTGRPATDEREIARRFAVNLNIPFTDVEIDAAAMVDEFRDLIRAMDTPIGDIAAFGYYAVSRAARQAGVPVLLSGMGGDELFWGYEWVRDAARAAAGGKPAAEAGLWRRLFGARAIPDSKSIYAFALHADIPKAERLSRSFLGGAGLPDDHWLTQTRTLPSDRPAVAVTEALMRSWLLCNCLTLVDRMSMAHSIEMRVPFLDIDLTNGVLGMRAGGLHDFAKPHKWLLLEGFGHLLPSEIRDRPKQGFTPPVQDWIAAIVEHWQLRSAQDSTLVRQGVIEWSALQKIWKLAPAPFRHRLTVLELWIAQVFERMPSGNQGRDCSLAASVI